MSTSPGLEVDSVKSPADPPPSAWTMSMAARKSGRATASAGHVEDDGEGDAQAAQQDHLERRRGRPDVVGVERRDQQPRAEHRGERARSGESAIAASPATMATTKVSPIARRHERRELRRVQLRELRGDEDVGEGGADNG